MAKLAGTKILEKLIIDGIITPGDIKPTTQAEKRLFYELGGYKGISIERDFLCGFLRESKKLIDQGLPVTMDNLIGYFQKDIYRLNIIFNHDILSDIKDEEGYIYSYMTFRVLKFVRRNKKIKKGSDLFIKGLGTFDISAIFNSLPNYQRYTSDIWDIQKLGYFPEATYSLDFFMNKPNYLKWIKDTSFDQTRVDELQNLYQMDLFDIKLSKKVITNRLNELNSRNLVLKYSDRSLFKYPQSLLDRLALTDLILPKDGIELKRTALRFKNCAANYVNEVYEKESFIAYNDNEMIQLKRSDDHFRILQHFGPRNDKLPSALREKRYDQFCKNERKITPTNRPNLRDRVLMACRGNQWAMENARAVGNL